jgi:hypothetical protein
VYGWLGPKEGADLPSTELPRGWSSYDRMIRIADKPYDIYIEELKRGTDPMTGHRPFKGLTKSFSDASKARVAARVFKLKSEMALHELRLVRKRSQQGLARELDVGQSAVVKLDRGETNEQE